MLLDHLLEVGVPVFQDIATGQDSCEERYNPEKTLHVGLKTEEIRNEVI